MVTIVLVRHGNTDWDLEQIFRGRSDIDLNDVGIKQVQLLAQYLEAVQIEAVYSSPLRRALQTAAMVAAPHYIDAIPTWELVNLDYGEWEGLSHEIIKNKCKTLYTDWLNKPSLKCITEIQSSKE